MPRQLAQISGDRMAGIQRKQFALDERHQIISQLHARNGGQFAFKLGFIDDPLTEGLDGHFQRIAAARFARRHDAVNGGIDEADMLLDPGVILLRQRGQHMRFQLTGAAHHIFTGDNV